MDSWCHQKKVTRPVYSEKANDMENSYKEVKYIKFINKTWAFFEKKKLETIYRSGHRITVYQLKPVDGIFVNDRNCTFCNVGKLADEFLNHFILEWKSLLALRKNIILSRYCQRPNTIKFREQLMASNLKTLKKNSALLFRAFGTKSTVQLQI